MDAYQRAADLDPQNVHIKARLQLLRNGPVGGMPNQHSIPMPQDVHPQQYQAANVGAPPGPQWGAQAPVQAPPSQGPVAPGPGNDWNNRRLAAIDQPSNIYGERDPIRTQLPPRQSSPRQDQMRQYQQPEQPRHTPIRQPSPARNMHPQSAYPGPSNLPQTAPLQPPPPPIPTRERITNPNYPAPNPIGPSNGTHGGPGSVAPYRVPDGRGGSPLPEIPPLMNDRMPSPNSGYPHPQYSSHHPNTSHPGGIASGAPPPTAALVAAEAAALREREERPVPGPFKRMVEPEDDYKMSNKKPVNGETRARLEDLNYRRDSPTERQPASPPQRHRRSSSELRRDDQIRRADMNYHPSEAAHHPTSLPPLHPHPEHLPPVSQQEPPREARREPAAREVNVDDNYDDDGEDDKRMVTGSGGRNSPQQRGLMNGQPKVEPQG